MQSSVTACFLLLVFPVNAHVVENFNEDCMEYFYNGHVPTWTSNNHVHICQVFNNCYHFATLYDTTNRIPVYSAYKVEDGKSSDHRWMVEPQLVKQEFEKKMMTQDSVKHKHPTLDPKEIGKRQATDEDYEELEQNKDQNKDQYKDQYNHGHLNPSSHHAGDASKATYTLTNIVPQRKKLNEKKWSLHEAKLKALAKDNSVYVLVGAIPSEGNWIKRDNEARVNIPDYMWVAYCYYDQTSQSYKSGGATAKNVENKIYECTVSQLQAFLEKHKQVAGQLFDNNCYVEQAAGASAAGASAAGASAAAGNPCDI